ncbi:hypothetical protein LR48_Vigan08g095100 [Vigna angularis]|uniref:Uncharacterized protein n=1 Tax=Phaseolus angularis TaxID=3914 RepID=A0A0L9V617_PHAAN|nr:hypothetical protein LR48_Vigan08g095100 [Vigna angularis]
MVIRFCACAFGKRSGAFGDLWEEVVGEVEFIYGDALEALEEETKKFEAGGLGGVRLGIEGLVFLGGSIDGESTVSTSRLRSARGSRDQALKHDRKLWSKLLKESDKTEMERQGKF